MTLFTKYKYIQTMLLFKYYLQLYDALSREDISDCISWLPGGRTFIILDPNKFVSNVLPSFHKVTKIESFTRKLRRWGFLRLNRGAGTNIFYHEVSTKIHQYSSCCFVLGA